MGSCIRKRKKVISHPQFTSYRFKKGVLIGEGGYGKVYECLNLDTGSLYAVKHIELAGTSDQISQEVSRLKEEIKIFQKLSHKNIVQYLHTDLDEECTGVDIIMELVPGGSLRHLLNKFGRFEEKMTVLYLSQIVEGVNYLHLQGIIHRDIKSANILVSQNGVIKLSDFGASKKLKNANLEEDELCNSLQGSPYWMAPEIAKRVGHSFPVDIWSIGCVAIEMLTGKAPWSSVSTSVKEVLSFIKEGKKPEIPAGLSENCQDFIQRCLQIDPSLRPTASDLRRHRFLIKNDVI